MSSVAPRCVHCGANTREARICASYAEVGLDSVHLDGVRAQVCAEAGHTRVLIDNRPQLHRAIALRLVRKRALLTAEEVRFLRMHLRCSNDQFARCLGVTAGTASRWTSPAAKMPIAATADRLLRLLVAVQDRHDGTPLQWLCGIGRTPLRPERIDLWAIDGGWSATSPR